MVKDLEQSMCFLIVLWTIGSLTNLRNTLHSMFGYMQIMIYTIFANIFCSC